MKEEEREGWGWRAFLGDQQRAVLVPKVCCLWWRRVTISKYYKLLAAFMTYSNASVDILVLRLQLDT